MRITKKPEERKLEIVKAALELFLQKGYDNVTVKDITTKVNVAAGLFHYYFHSKEDVLFECVRLDRKNFFDALTRSNCFPDDMCAIDKINLLLSKILHNIAARTQLFKDSWSINSAMLVNQVKYDVLGAIADKMTEFIIQGNQEGVFDCKYPRETAEIAVFGLSHQFSREQERNPSLQEYLLGEYVFIEKEKYRTIFMGMLNMKEPRGLFEFEGSDISDDADTGGKQP
jgi:Transcriptional regulator